MQNLQINPQRLWDTLMETAQFGATAKGGISRLTLTDDDRQVRDWFKAQCEALGCTVTVDEVGNMFARRPGRNDDAAADRDGLASRHPADRRQVRRRARRAGRARGDAHAGHELGYETNAPIEVVNWTNEEGSRFAPAMLASGVFAGVFTPDYAYAREDREGKTLRRRAGADRLPRARSRSGGAQLGAMFELHIEQGPILEDEGKMIGVVTGRAGHALVRGHGHRPGRAYRRDADAPAQERAARAPRA